VSAYQLGLTGGGVVVPEQATYALDRLGRITSSSRSIFRNGSRFYGRGVVGADTTPGNLVAWTLDLFHVILLLGGALLLWSALVG